MAIGRAISELLLSGAADLALPGPGEARRARARLARARRVQRLSARLLADLGFEVAVRGAENLRSRSGGAPGRLIVANHVSFWDIPVLSSILAPAYVTSVEVRETPVLGWIARAGGCLFVERRGGGAGLSGEIGGIGRELARGLDVAVFPEATSGSREQLLRFRSSLFRAAVAVGRPVLPVCINYVGLDDESLHEGNRDEIFYYGDQAFGRQLARILRRRRVRVELEIGAPLRAAGTGPRAHKELCAESFAFIERGFRPLRPAPDLSLSQA